MARRIDSRIKIDCLLEARTPIHVGSGRNNAETDLALAVNGRNEYYIPGASIAGALRAWLETGADEQTLREIRSVWGYQESDKRKAERDKERGPAEEHASFVLVEDAVITVPAGKFVSAEVRDGVGIDRLTGAAANQIKFDRTVLPRGTRFAVTILVELNKESEDLARAQMNSLAEALRGGLIRFGAAKSRGLGNVTIKDLSISEQGFLRMNGLLDTLRGGSHSPKADYVKFKLPARPSLSFEIGWRPLGPLMVKAEHDGIGVNMLPLVSAIDALRGDLSFILPGSSIKGAIRSQAERITRTLLNVVGVRLVLRKQDFIRQIAVKEPGQARETDEYSLIEWLFGVAGESEAEGKKKKGSNGGDLSNPLPGLSAVSIDDCFAELKFAAEQWAAVEKAKEDELRGTLDAAGLTNARQVFHVAIDRWLGSAADGFLYSVLEPHGVAWEPIRLTLDLSRLPDEDRRKQSVMCMLLVLRDFAAGRIPLGHGANRGMGGVEMTSLKINPRDCQGINWLKETGGVAFSGGKLVIPAALQSDLNDTWRAWLHRQTGERFQ